MSPSPPPEPSDATLRPGDWRVDIWRAFLRAHAEVVRQLERDLMADVGMPLPWYDVLLQLVEAPGHRLRMADLADRVLLSRSGLTRLIDRLQAAGLVRRAPSPHDARGTYTVVTEDGMARLRAAAPFHLASVQRAWMQHFSDDELRTLGELLERVRPVAE
ncbi:MarR family winged helix-turn-helix transcriptional regulator [uncultured Jatrophihabitans sp.]|uniref:MarR family winged helix-turn-helix transcriptional regulator n=1 Tax=uncultured Jatrophihabitans sp. TaxID=1610747 RepID=UPI0035CA15C9